MSLHKFFLLLAILATAGAGPAQAGADFYGVQMKSEDFARNVFLRENNQVPDFSNDKPGINKKIYAYAYASGTVGGGKGLSVEVFNHSDKAIATERVFRDAALLTWDGRRFDRSETEMQWARDVLDAGDQATFNFAFPGVQIPKEQIRMIICSFNMGETTLYLFPLEQAPPSSAAQPAPAEKNHGLFGWFKKTPSEKSGEPAAIRTEPPPSEPAELKSSVPCTDCAAESAAQPGEVSASRPPADENPCLKPVRAVQDLFRGIGHGIKRVIEDVCRDEGEAAAPVPAPVAPSAVAEPAIKAAPKAPDTVVPVTDPNLAKPGQVIGGAQYHFVPARREDIAEAGKYLEKKVHQDRPWSLSPPAKTWTHEETRESRTAQIPRQDSKVILVNKDYGFIVVDAGYRDGFTENVIFDVMRGGRRIAKAMVTKPREKIAAAVILPEWNTAEAIGLGDSVVVA